MSPPEFLEHLAALVPRPCLHLIRYHGVPAPNAALRSQIVPSEAEPAPARASHDEEPTASTQAQMTWAQLLKRVFTIDLTTCSHCGGTLAIIAAIEDPAVISKILSHLGLPRPRPTQGSGPPQRLPPDCLTR